MTIKHLRPTDKGWETLKPLLDAMEVDTSKFNTKDVSNLMNTINKGVEDVLILKQPKS